MDTAALMQSLDLVITSDTVIPHLAGALGVPVWVALTYAPDWRFLLDRDDSPWYPTMRLFRQRKFGDWTEVFERIADELAKRVRSFGWGDPVAGPVPTTEQEAERTAQEGTTETEELEPVS
jgi:ADP-heptose:LPS heptosyltransferase